jgi:hypothetical protein
MKGEEPMRRLSRIVFGALGCVLMISGIGVLMPRAYAVVATIIRDQDQPARHPFATLCGVASSSAQFGNCDTPAIPAGQQFVVETVAFFGDADPSNFVLETSLVFTTGGTKLVVRPNPIFDDNLNQPRTASFNNTQPLRFYADSGSVISCFFLVSNGNPTSGFGPNCAFSGYLVSLP